MNNTIRLLFTGDLFPANSEYSIGSGIASGFLRRGSEAWAPELKGYFSGKDISIINLESPLCSKDVHRTDYCGSIDFAGYLKRIGVTAVSIANNHILEHGTEGFRETLNALKGKGLQVLGEAEEDGRARIFRQRIKGRNIAMASFNAIHDIKNPGCYAEYGREKVLDSIRQMQKVGNDLAIICLHWGDEYVHLPAPWQIEDAHAFIDAGADLVIGTHPHVIQPVERYKHGVIFYSLGNFLFDMFDSEHVRIGLVARIDMHEDGSLDAGYDLIYIDDDCIPRELKGEKLKKYQNILDKGLMTVTGLYLKDREAYICSYERKRKNRRFLQRIRMKTTLVRNWIKLTPEAKKRLLTLWKKKITKAV
jgi:poly-gamma-glutamate synthesis protein (capsule biosynthesis protein)